MKMLECEPCDKTFISDKSQRNHLKLVHFDNLRLLANFEKTPPTSLKQGSSFENKPSQIMELNPIYLL